MYTPHAYPVYLCFIKTLFQVSALIITHKAHRVSVYSVAPHSITRILNFIDCSLKRTSR